MSSNKSRAEKSEAQLRKSDRSRSSGQQRGFSGSGSKGGGGTTPPPSSSINSSSSLSVNRSFEKSSNGQGGQSRVNPANVNSESNVSAARAIQNGAHIRPPIHGASDAPLSGVGTKPINSSSSRSIRAVTQTPSSSSQSSTRSSDSVAPTTPVKGDVSSMFPLQFGSISSGFVSGIQIPARTSSAPPNLDEQKHNQVRHDSLRAAPALPIPSIPKQQPRKDTGSVKQSNTVDAHPRLHAKKDGHAQIPAAPATTMAQKSNVPPVTETPKPLPFQQPQVPVPFGGQNAHIKPQGITSTSLQMSMPLPVGSAPQLQQVFVPNLHSHPLHPQGMMHQTQNLTFPPQMGPQYAPQQGNLGMGIPPQFTQQQSGKFVAPRKTVKITHPETHEELRLDMKADSYLDGVSSAPRSHANVTLTPHSQPIPAFAPAHQINYYSPMQPNSYNPTSIYYQTQTPVPLASNQVTSSSPASRYNYQVGQGPQAVSFMNPTTSNSVSVTKNMPQIHGISEPPNTVQSQEAHVVSSSVQVIVKPPIGSLGERSGLSSTVVSSHTVSKGESPKPVKPQEEASKFHLERGSEIGPENFIQKSKSVPEQSGTIPLSSSAKLSAMASTTVSVQKPPPSDSSSFAAPSLDKSASVMTTIDGRRKEPDKRLDSFKDNQKKPNKKDIRLSLPQHQADGSYSSGSSNSLSPKMSLEITKHSENMQTTSEVVESITSFPSQGLKHNISLLNGISETQKAETSLSTPETAIAVLKHAGESLPDNYRSGSDASSAVTEIARLGDGSSNEPSNTSSLGTANDNLDAAHHAKQNDSSLQEVLLKQDIMATAEQGKIDLIEGTKHERNILQMSTGSSSEPLVGIKKTVQDSNPKETNVANKSVSVETGQESNNEAVDFSSKIREEPNYLGSPDASLDYVDTEKSPSSVLCNVPCKDKNTTLDDSTNRTESVDGREVAESDVSHQGSVPGSIPVLSDLTQKVEGKGVETSEVGPVSTSLPGSKEKPTLETNRAKTTVAKSKKKRKEILQKADAAGTTSDLYMAYKGPQEKQETLISSESLENTSRDDVKPTPGDGIEKDVIVSDKDAHNKAEPDDWEDAADISTPNLKALDDVKHSHGGSVYHDDDENGASDKKYSRDFLLTFSEQCTDLPPGFEIGSDIAEALMSIAVGISHLVDRESYINSGKIMDRSTGGSRLERRGSGIVDDDRWSKAPGPFGPGRDLYMEVVQGGTVVGFRPGQGGIHGVLRNPRGQSSMQYVGGILSGPIQSMASQGGIQRNSPDDERWQRARGLIPSPQTPSQVMHKAENRYEVGKKVSDQEEIKQRQLKAILNKLTPQNFEKLFEQVKEVNIDNVVTLNGVISQIFDKALMEPTFCEMYAKFCYHLAAELPDLSEGNEKITFKRLLLNKCQEEFERGEREQAEANKVEEDGEIKRTQEEREEKKVQARRRMLGNIRLIGELYKKKMLTERIMHECIQKLLGPGQHQTPDEEDIEALCKLMSTIGEIIDHPKAKEHMDCYFDMMAKLSINMELSSRVRFMLKDVIDLRRNKWQQRRKVEGPKKIDELHRDVAQQRQAQASRLARGSGTGSSARRGQPMDFGPRGSTVLSSPNSQMGGPRGLLPQVRGYAAQDVRMDDRRPYESRTLAVTLPQRLIDDHTITLGPQGGLARGMSTRGQPLMSSVPLTDISPSPIDSRRLASGPDGYSSIPERTPYNSREELMPRFVPERFMGPPAYDRSNSQDRNTYFRNQDIRSADHSLDSSAANLPATNIQGFVAQNISSEKVWPEERLQDMSISAIREFYSAKDEKEVALCIKDMNSPSFFPSMISIWVTDSFERKDVERDLLAKLLVNLTKPVNSVLNQDQLVKGFESVLATLEDAINDAPKAAEFLGFILARAVLENVIPLREIGRLINEGGEEPGRLRQIGLASEVLGSILEIISFEKGESVLNEIRASSNLRLEDFRPPNSFKSKKLEAFI